MAWIARPSRAGSPEDPELEPAPARRAELPSREAAPDAARGGAFASEVDPELARLPAPERELERWRRQRAARDALDEIDPTYWDPERPDARRPPPDDDEEPPAPALAPRPRTALYVGTFVLWASVLTLVGEPWWELEHGPLISIGTPLLVGRLIERLLLRARPDWNRHEDADVVHARRRPELGERARPYWAREDQGAGAPDEGETSARGREEPLDGVRSPGGEGRADEAASAPGRVDGPRAD